MTKAKAAALAESNEEAVELRSHRSFADGSETLSGYFCGNVRETVPQKNGRTETSRRTNGECQVCRAKGQGERGSLWRS